MYVTSGKLKGTGGHMAAMYAKRYNDIQRTLSSAYSQRDQINQRIKTMITDGASPERAHGIYAEKLSVIRTTIDRNKRALNRARQNCVDYGVIKLHYREFVKHD